MKKDHIINIVYFAVAVVAITLLRDLWVQQQKVGKKIRAASGHDAEDENRLGIRHC